MGSFLLNKHGHRASIPPMNNSTEIPINIIVYVFVPEVGIASSVSSPLVELDTVNSDEVVFAVPS